MKLNVSRFVNVRMVDDHTIHAAVKWWARPLVWLLVALSGLAVRWERRARR